MRDTVNAISHVRGSYRAYVGSGVAGSAGQLQHAHHHAGSGHHQERGRSRGGDFGSGAGVAGALCKGKRPEQPVLTHRGPVCDPRVGWYTLCVSVGLVPWLCLTCKAVSNQRGPCATCPKATKQPQFREGKVAATKPQSTQVQ